MNTSTELTNYYWELLKSLNDDIKLRLATRLTASVLENKEVAASNDLTEDMIKKHSGKWVDDRIRHAESTIEKRGKTD